MKRNIIPVKTRPQVANLLICLTFLLCLIHGYICVEEETKKSDIKQDESPKLAQAPVGNTQNSKKLDGNFPLKGEVPRIG